MFVCRSYDRSQRDEVVKLVAAGIGDREISRRTGVTRSTVRNWRLHGIPERRRRSEPLPPGWRPPNSERYAYLLGLYLGDGHVARHGNSFGLHLYLDLAHPEILREAERAIGEVLSTPIKKWIRPGTNCMRLTSYGPHWPQVFPQHGAGPKHKRKIELKSWQSEIVDRHPKAFLRGLIHSDGSRSVNRFTVQLKDGPKQYAYVRYFFSNLSEDIRGLFCAQCDRLGIRWSMSNPRNVSISDRASVAKLDEFVGPKR